MMKLNIFNYQLLQSYTPSILSAQMQNVFYSLRESLGIQANNLHSLDIKGYEYRNSKFVVGFGTEKC